MEREDIYNKKTDLEYKNKALVNYIKVLLKPKDGTKQVKRKSNNINNRRKINNKGE